MATPTRHNDFLATLKSQEQRFINELKDWLRIPSVSADSAYHADTLRAADFLLNEFRKLGLDNAQLLPTDGFPAVYGEKVVDPAQPTVLVYGHYDVQPADPIDLWTTPPFEPEIRDGKIYARGACDDKGQVYMHVKAAEILLTHNALNCNIKFFIEGEEEVGSSHLEECVAKYADLLKCDTILISDTSMIANDTPSLTVSLRGLSYLEVEVTGPNRDLHSGVYGGAVANPINVLCQMIAKLHDEQGRITIPGFYDDVREYTAEERAELARVPFDQAAYNRALDIAATGGENGYTVLEQVSIRPTLDCNGIWGGYTGEGSKTVLPSKAFAKISMRLVSNQNSARITQLFKDYFPTLAPSTVKVVVREHHGGEPFETDTQSAGYAAAYAAMQQAFGKAPIPAREGGSIPIVLTLAKYLKADVVLMGFGLNSDAIHSPNEHYGVFNFLKGIETICLFYEHLAVRVPAQV